MGDDGTMTEPQIAGGELVELDQAECWSLLAGHTVGRLAVIAGQRPLVFPVNYALDGDLVIVRTGPGTKLANASLDRVAFEVDQLDAARRTGWSVLVQGLAVDVTSAIDEASERERAMLVDSWVQGDKPHLIRIVHPEISGRRVTASASGGATAADLADHHPVHLPAGATLREAAAAMADAGVSAAVVGTHSPPWLVTEHDLAGAISAGMTADDTVGSLASRSPVWGTASTTVAEAVDLMGRHSVRHLVVLDAAGHLVGLLSLLRAVSALSDRR